MLLIQGRSNYQLPFDITDNATGQDICPADRIPITQCIYQLPFSRQIEQSYLFASHQSANTGACDQILPCAHLFP